MQRLFMLTLVLLLSPCLVTAGTITGVVNSNKDSLTESQSVVVVWVEGLPAGRPETSVPVMKQSGGQFSPRVLTVVAGQTVSFPNEDDVAHNVFSLSKAKKFRLGIYPKGETEEVTFEAPGVVDVFCLIHRHMHAVIIVTPNEYQAGSALGKPYTIHDVPAGNYTLKAWNAAHKIVTTEVTVPEADAVTVPIMLED